MQKYSDNYYNIWKKIRLQETNGMNCSEYCGKFAYRIFICSALGNIGKLLQFCVTGKIDELPQVCYTFYQKKQKKGAYGDYESGKS